MMQFHNPYLLAGAAAAAVPLLIFLFTRDTVKKVAFSTLRFFAGSSATLIKRKRWQEALLLAMRMGICALLAVAFARPFLAKKSAGEGDPNHAKKAVAVVVDVSASMGQPGVFDEAQKQVAGAFRELPEDTAVAVIAFDRVPRVEVPLTRDAAKAQEKAAALTPGAGGTDMAAAIRQADETLTQVSADEKEIVLISDLPRSGWAGYVGSWKVHQGVKLTVLPVAAGRSVDAAIVAADVPQGIANDGTARAVTVRVADFSGKDIKDLPVRLVVGDKEIETQTVQVPAGGRVVARFRHVFDRAGDNRGMIKIGPKDNAALGSTLYFNTRVLPKIDVTILSGPAARQSGDALFFLETALVPAPESPFAFRTVAAASAKPADIASADVVILADVDRVNAETKKALGAVLQRGGGLLFLPGSQVSAESFSAAFGELAPCKLRRVIQASEGRRGDAKAVLTKINYEHPVMELFQRPHYGDFAAVTFERYWEVTNSQLAKVAARFDDGRPFLLERSLDQGSSVLLASPPDVRWNNLPDRAIFLPLIHQVTRHLAQRTEPVTAYAVGEYLPVPAVMSLRDPSGKTCEAGKYLATSPGYFTLVDGTGNVQLTYAVNCDLSEAESAGMDAGELVAAVTPEKVANTSEQIAGGSVGAALGREFWAYIISALVLLVVSELFVANRVARH